jgi:hypothetical protein
MSEYTGFSVIYCRHGIRRNDFAAVHHQIGLVRLDDGLELAVLLVVSRQFRLALWRQLLLPIPWTLA